MRSQRIENFEVPLGSYIFKRDESGAKLQLKDGKSFTITLPESRILYKLLQTPNDVVDKNTLILEAWGSTEIIGSNSLPVAITNLRKILKLKNIHILNSPKKGYLIQIPESELNKTNDNNGEIFDKTKEDENLEIPDHNALKSNNTITVINNSKKLWPIYLTIFLICFDLYIIFYTWLSWVDNECTSFNGGTVCYIKEDHPPDSVEMNRKIGDFFYSSGSGWIEVKGKHYD